MKEIGLRRGDSLSILLETKEFFLGCCDCGLVHKIKVTRKKGNVILQFFRHKCKKCNGLLNINGSCRRKTCEDYKVKTNT